MDKENNVILEELAENFPALTYIPRHNIYSLPHGYFQTLTGAILEKINLEVEQTGVPVSSNPYSVPEGFFEQLPGNILAKIKEEHKTSLNEDPGFDNLFPVLSGLKSNPYKVPEGYFEQLEPGLPAVKTERKNGKVLQLFRKISVSRYAAAAAITAILASGIFFFNNENSSVSSGADKYKYPTATFDARDIQTLSEDEISDFLKTHSTSQGSSSTSPNIMLNNKPVENNMQSISDQEIQEYLKNNPEPGEQSSSS